MDNLVVNFGLNPSSVAHLTSAVQFGFIIGTLLFAILMIADRFPSSRVFFISALLGALFNLGTIWEGNSLNSLLALRFFTGLFLAGIYPVGMKIAADYYQKGLGKSLGYLVGALVLGTAFPHLLKALGAELPWKFVLIGTSTLAMLGGLSMLLFVPNGPYRKAGSQFDASAFFKVFRNRSFRIAAFGYFGHMWELYAFWAFVPILLQDFNTAQLNISIWSFSIIAIGAIACIIGGYISLKSGTQRTAIIALTLSALCCLVSPFFLQQESTWLLLIFLLFWGAVVIADSPLFSTLVAQSAEPELKGTALTIVNCLGFAITIISIQLLSFLHTAYPSPWIYTLLFLGPALGLIALRRTDSVSSS